MDKFKKVLEYIFIIVLIVLECFLVTRKAVQNDTFYSIKIGESIVTHGMDSVSIDPFSWHEDLKYANPHWLNDVVIYVAYHIFNFEGIYVLVILETAILGLILFYTLSKYSNNKPLSFIASLFMIYSLNRYIAARAQLVSYIFFVLEVYFIENYIKKNQKRYIIGIFIVSVLLANTHMAVYPMAFVFLLPYIAEEILAKLLKGESKTFLWKVEIDKNNHLKKLLGVALVIALAGFINPMGLEPFTYLVKTMMGTSTHYIMEHSRLNFLYLEYSKYFFITYGLILFCCVCPKVKIKLHDFFWIIGLVVLSIISIRNTALLVILAYKVIVPVLSDFFEWVLSLKIWNGSRFVILRCGIWVFLLFMIFYVSLKFYHFYQDDEYVNKRQYPVGAARWIKEHLELKDLRLLNSYADGSYLVFAGIPDFIDTRCDLFCAEFNPQMKKGEDIFLDYMRLQENADNYEKVLEKYDINCCLIHGMPSLDENIGFSKIYDEGGFAIYLKNELLERVK